MIQWQKLVIPNARIDRRAFGLMVAVEIVIAVAAWCSSTSPFMPTPKDISAAFVDLWNAGLAVNLMASLSLNVEAILIATIISLGIAWIGTIAIFRPLVQAVGKLRYVSMAGLLFAFTLMTRNGHQFKLAVLVWSVTVFFVVSMVDVLSSIPRETFDLARVLHMGPWRLMWEVQVLGAVDKAFDVMRQNVAMAWLTLAFAEALSREDGGIGAMLATSAKYQHLAEIAALQVTIFSLGIMQDYLIGALKRLCCPYAFLTMEAR